MKKVRKIYLPRQLVEENIIKNKDLIFLYICISMLSYEEDTVLGNVLSCRTTLPRLSEFVCTGIKPIRTMLNKLKEGGYITITTDKRGTTITLLEGASECKAEETKNSTCKAEESKCTTLEELDKHNDVIEEVPSESCNKELTKEEMLYKRAEKFYNSIIPYCDKYSKDMLRSFYDYWSEPNISCTKMRFEKETTWDLSRRLARWSKNNFDNRANETRRSDNPTREERDKSATELVTRLLSESGIDI